MEEFSAAWTEQLWGGAGLDEDICSAVAEYQSQARAALNTVADPNPYSSALDGNADQEEDIAKQYGLAPPRAVSGAPAPAAAKVQPEVDTDDTPAP